MEIILILFLLLLLVLLLFLIFRIIKWVLKSKIRIISSLSLIGLLGVLTVINKVFFQKMEFIQSKVYPDLYLVKYPIKDRDSINKIIKTIVVEKLENGFANEKVSNKNPKKTIRFYKYTTVWGFDNGTKYFIENKEDVGGFSTEELNNYDEFQIAYFKVTNCRSDSINYIGNLSYFKDGNKIKTDTVINLCQSNDSSGLLNLKDIISIQELIDLTKLKATEKYDTPSSSEQFVLDDEQGEFRNSISYKFTKKERQSKSILIDEVTWEKDKNTWITVWYEAQEKTVPKAIFE